ncbi:hypothetical protein Plhal304r1_c018g0065821 [Plasmopara halstedii]
MSQRLNNWLERQHNKKGNTLTLSSKIKPYEKTDEVMTIPVISRNLSQKIYADISKLVPNLLVVDF